MRKRRGFTIYMCLNFIFGIFTLHTYANGFPANLENSITTILVPNGDTGVKVESENLTFDFSSPNAYSSSVPFVTAKYRLMNTQSKQSLKVAFLYLEQTNDLKVKWNDKEVSLTTPGADYPKNWIPPKDLENSWLNIKSQWMDPSTGKVYNTKTVFPNGIHGALFPIEMNSGESGDLVVTYHQRFVDCDKCNQRERAIYHFTYLLSPAKYWASFGSINIKVIYPDTLQLVTNPKLTNVLQDANKKTLTGNFNGLPSNEFNISVKSIEQENNSPIKYSLIITLILIFIFLIFLILLIRKGRGDKKRKLKK